MKPVASFRTMLQQAPVKLAKISSAASERRPNPDAWSPRQELGHLLDSAIMNHQRVLRVLSENNPTLSGYDADFCVAAHDYHSQEWEELISTWQALNRHFLWSIERIPDDQWQRPYIYDGKNVTLEFLVTDYIQHAIRHLQHIGVQVGDAGERAIA